MAKESRCGTTAKYWSGCRCGQCREANRVYCASRAATPEGKAAKQRAMRKWSQSPQGKLDQRKRGLARISGCTLEYYDVLLTAQKHVCAICRQPCSQYRNLSVDHCHKSGKIRGLLCGHCNTGLGKFKDNSTLLQAAIDYLATSG